MTASLFLHPRIHTLETDEPVDGAIVVDEGRIVFVGALEEARACAGQGAPETRLEGGAVLPAFHDAHFHIGNLAREMVAPDLHDAESHAEVVELLRAFAEEHPGDAWVAGGRWNRNAWIDGVEPHRATLDEIFGDRPAMLPSVDGHAVWASSAALRAVGIDAATADPAGGEIVRDAVGEPTGLLLEAAGHEVRHVAEASLGEQLPELLGRAQRQLLALGIAHITDLDGQEVREALLRMHERGELIIRVHKGTPSADLELAIAEGRRTGRGDDRFTDGPVKFFSDGALGPHTAHMHEDFVGEAGNRGIEVTTFEDLVAGFSRANEHGLAVATHAIGDRANSNVLQAYAAVADLAREQGLRNRVEHAQHLKPGDIASFASNGVVASLQPTHCTTDYPLSVSLLGDRDTLHYPWRSLLDAGATVAFGSDAPVEPANPFFGLHAAVTREQREGEPPGGREPEQRVDVIEALRCFTLGPALAAGLDDRTGAITPGRFADFIAVDADPFLSDPRDLWRTRVLTTVVGGEIVHDSRVSEAS